MAVSPVLRVVFPGAMLLGAKFGRGLSSPMTTGLRTR